MAILLPNGNAVSGGTYVITYCVEGSKIDTADTPASYLDLLAKHYTIGVDIPKLGREELSGLISTGQQLANTDIDFQVHMEDVPNYRMNVSIVWMQKLDS